VNPRRQYLGARLREVRAARFPSGSAFAEAIDWPQPRVSKLETGAQFPTEDDIRAWVQAAGANPAVEQELLELLADARVEYVNARDVQRAGGLAKRQTELGVLEQQATTIREWQPLMVPGLLQTEDYARELLSLPGGPPASEVGAMVAARMQRQNVLYQRGKSITFVIGEMALRTPPGAPEVLRSQLERLMVTAGFSSVTIGVLPLGRPMPALPTGTFTLHDDSVVLLEVLTQEATLAQPEEVKEYREHFGRLLAASVVGQDAVALIRGLLTATARGTQR
jgi:transcriptional regulator with XRE-family HTH domain